MSDNNYISILLNLKEENITFDKILEENIKGTVNLVIYGKLINKPNNCPCCGSDKINIHGYKESTIKLMPVSGFNALLKLNKQRYKCKNCNKTFIAKTNIVKKHCFISNNVKYGVALKASNKISEKDIASDFNISHNTVNRIINSFFEKYKVNYKHLPEVLCFDEFKSTKDADGAMSFIYCDAKNHKIIDIVENRQLKYLKKYFSRYPKKVRNKVKYIVMDMYKPYISLVKEIFPKAKIIMDKFHIVNNLSRALNKARIKLMNKDKKLYKKLKRYYKYLLKNRSSLDCVHFRKYVCFNKMMSQLDVVDYLLEQDEVLKNTYFLYQNLLSSIKHNNGKRFINLLDKEYENISEYMETSLNTTRGYKDYILNALKYGYTNGVIEGINNKIKAIKRIAFGYRSFFNFRNRILIMNDLVNIKNGNV